MPRRGNLARAALPAGDYALSLIEDATWALRRVETIHVLDSHRVERRVTVDIASDDLRSRARASGLKIPPDGLPIPLVCMQKGLLFDVDVRDSTGAPVPIATSDEDSKLAVSALLALLVREGRSVARTDVGAMVTVARGEDFHGQLPPALSVALAQELRVPAFAELLDWFGSNFMMTVRVPANSVGTIIMKYRYVEPVNLDADLAVSERLGFSPPLFLFEVPAIAQSQREHTRIVAPSGVSIGETVLIDTADIHAVVGHQRRSMPERATIYTGGIPPGRYAVLAEFVPNVDRFHLPATFVVGLNMVMLVAGLYLQLLHDRFTDGSVRDSAVAVLTLVPSLAAVYLSRSDEHDLVSVFRRVPRALVLVASVNTVFVGAAVAANVQGDTLDWLFLSAAFTTWSAFALLLWTLARNHILRRGYSRTLWE